MDASLTVWLTVIGMAASVVIALISWGFVTGRWVERNERRRPDQALADEMPNQRRSSLSADVRALETRMDNASKLLSDLTGKLQECIDLREQVRVLIARLDTLERHIDRDIGRLEDRASALERRSHHGDHHG